MYKLNRHARVQIIRSLCEGNSLIESAKLCDCSVGTVAKLLVEVGSACSRYQQEHVRDLNTLNVRCEQILSFEVRKGKRGDPSADDQGQGDAWTWVAIDSDTKLVVTWLVGMRNASNHHDFHCDLASRLRSQGQVSADGLAEVSSIESGVISNARSDEPNVPFQQAPANGTTVFPKRLESYRSAFALYAMFYNYCRPHHALTMQSGPKGRKITTTPAMASGLTDHVWSVSELLRSVQTEM